MAWTYGFFNSVNGDRLYNADQMSHIFEGLITDGVYEAVGNKLAVQPNAGMVVQIATGRGWFNKRWVNNDSEYLLTLEGSDVVLNRYCAVCIRVDTSDSVREVTPYLKYSDFATNPVKPDMERTETIKEYCLAYVYIPAKATEIKASNIEDARFDSSVCGWVTGLIEQLDTTTLYSQWEALFSEFMTVEVDKFNEWLDIRENDFNEWFSTLQVELDGDVATRLTNALPTNLTITLLSDSWDSDNKTQSVNVINMNDTKSVIVQPNDDTKEAYNSAGIICVSQSTNTLTFKADTVPTTDIKADIVHMGV